jgi:signal peptidase I
MDASMMQSAPTPANTDELSVIPVPTLRPKLHRATFIGEIIRTVLLIVALTALFDMAIPRSLVDGRSMEPTFVDGERLVVSRLHYLVDSPQRGQIVVFNSMREYEQGVMLIKRIIGLPGETVTIRDQRVSVNGVELDEPYIRENCTPSRCPDDEWQLASNEYFVMGDNRNNSQDSRRFGPVTSDHIVGTVVFRYWSLERFGIIDKYHYENLSE